MASFTRPLVGTDESEPGSTRTTLSTASLHLRELPSLRKTIVRLGNRAQRCRDELERVAGVPLANAPGEVSAQLPLVLWRAPLEWLVVTEPDQHAELAARLGQALGDATGLMADFSDALSVIELSGDAATAVLAKGCALDFSSWPERGGFSMPAACARVPVLVHRPNPGRFWLLVDRSLSHYMWEWLRTTAAEFEDSSSDQHRWPCR